MGPGPGDDGGLSLLVCLEARRLHAERFQPAQEKRSARTHHPSPWNPPLVLRSSFRM
jgi:hypothetical protein